MKTQTNISEFLSFLIPVSTDGTSLGRQGLQRLLLLRTFVTVASVAAVIILQAFFELEIPVTFIIYLIAGILLSVLIGYRRLAASNFISNFELFYHILVDVFFLVVLLLNTGGASNPLISYLLVLLALTATLLPQTFVNVFSIGGILIYTSFLLLDLSARSWYGNVSTERSNDFSTPPRGHVGYLRGERHSHIRAYHAHGQCHKNS